MTIKLEFPTTLWAARDAAIEGFYAGAPALAEENAIKQWLQGLNGNLVLCEFNEFYKFYEAGIGLILSLSNFSDLDVCDYLGIDREADVTDADRAEYVREKLEEARGDTGGPYLDCYPISDNSGRSAFIGVESKGLWPRWG